MIAGASHELSYAEKSSYFNTNLDSQTVDRLRTFMVCTKKSLTDTPNRPLIIRVLSPGGHIYSPTAAGLHLEGVYLSEQFFTLVCYRRLSLT
jgi:hypothetical protein